MVGPQRGKKKFPGGQKRNLQRKNFGSDGRKKEKKLGPVPFWGGAAGPNFFGKKRSHRGITSGF